MSARGGDATSVNQGSSLADAGSQEQCSDNLAPAFDYADLLLIDNTLPSSFSPFRTLEYAHYLDVFDAVLLSTEQWHSWISNASFDDLLATLPIENRLKRRVGRLASHTGIQARLAYLTFLNNTYDALPFLESRGIPFVMQLYPGGGFELNQPESNERLKRVAHSPLCRRIIATQAITQRYLSDQIKVPAERVALIYGGVFESRNDFDFWRDKVRYPNRKDTIDICFVAHNYGEVSSKGYDRFVEVAGQLARNDPRLMFHVVGGYEERHVPLLDLSQRFRFYGPQPSDFFSNFYPRMDLIVSLNRPFVLAPGAFDGFPTGSCMEAGLRGVLNCVNDPLDLNPGFKNGSDLLLVGDDPGNAAATIEPILREPERLYELSYRNWIAFRRAFDVDRQLWARTKVLVAELLQSKDILVASQGTGSWLDNEAVKRATASLTQHRIQLVADIDRLRAKNTKLRSQSVSKFLKRKLRSWRRAGRALKE